MYKLDKIYFLINLKAQLVNKLFTYKLAYKGYIGHIYGAI